MDFWSMRKLSASKGLVLISGATGFLGSRLSKELNRKNYPLVLLARSQVKIESLLSELKAENLDNQVFGLTSDLANSSSWRDLQVKLEDFNISDVINCVAIQGKPTISVSEFDYEDYRRVVTVNLEFAILLTFYFANKWKGSSGHSITHFSGGGAASPRPIFNSYSLSKTALVRFIENCSKMQEFKEISVNAVAPGLMPSQMLQQVLSNNSLRDTSEYANSTKANELGEESVSETIQLCEFILQHRKRFISGRLISAHWDDWHNWDNLAMKLENSELFTLRRVVNVDESLKNRNGK